MGEPLKITFHFQLQTQIPCQTTAKMKETHLSWSRGRVHCDITSPLGSFFPVLLLYFFYFMLVTSSICGNICRPHNVLEDIPESI